MPNDNEAGRVLWRAVGVHAGKVWEILFRNAVLSVLAVLGATVGGVLLVCKEWSFANHTLTVPGWSWILLLALYPFLFGAGVLLDVCWPLKYGEDNDIKNRLSIYIGRLGRDPLTYAEYTLHYRRLDRKYRLKRGSAKKYLAEVAREYGWEIAGIGRHTLRVYFDPDVSV